MEFKHISVLFEESIKYLKVKDNGIYVDGTLGGGGHSYGILKSNSTCKLVGIDQDNEAIKEATDRLKEFGDRVTIVKSNFREVKSVLDNLGIGIINGAVLDLGVSSYQLDNAKRGFSYMHDAPLDMRMDCESPKTAYDVVNTYSIDELMKIFYEYGEEKWSKRVAEFIVQKRESKPIETTGELVDIIKAAIPQKARLEGGHPAKRIFQAIRIEVNNELEILNGTIEDIVDKLEVGGRLAIITFQSLEDRLVKNSFKKLSTGCICPREFPICVCNNKPKVKIITRKPILPSDNEINNNSRSKSAKLRVIEKI